jgi:hypothetical protein|tara:strand:- start:228 stop:1028 length:801 start_codon:yes stop_codon:yes gene_type:complete
MSRATLIDERPEEEQEATDQLDTQDTIETPQEEEQPQEPDIPEKYRGKSVEELVQMHQELEKFSGKQSTEVGELRSVVDSYIQTQLSEQQAPQPQQQDDEDDVDFFVDPKTAVSRAIDNHPKIKEAQQYTAQAKMQAALSQLQQKHPDMESILKDAKFAEWIKGSKVRTKLFVEADQNYDFESADELFSLWKERNQVVQQTAQAEKAARKSAVKTASTGNARGTAEGSRKKVYRRADIIKLMKSDPERYHALSDELLKAYAEGRVR